MLAPLPPARPCPRPCGPGSELGVCHCPWRVGGARCPFTTCPGLSAVLGGRQCGAGPAPRGVASKSRALPPVSTCSLLARCEAASPEERPLLWGQGGGGRGGQPPPECPSRLWGVPRGESSAGLRFTALSCNKATELSPGLRVGVSLTWSVCGELRRGLVGLGAQSAQLVGDADRLVGRGWLCLWARIPTDLDSPAANGASSVTAPVQGWVPPGSGTWLRSAGGTGVPTPGPRTGSSDWQKVTAGWTLWSCWRQTVELTEANV